MNEGKRRTNTRFAHLHSVLPLSACPSSLNSVLSLSACPSSLNSVLSLSTGPSLLKPSSYNLRPTGVRASFGTCVSCPTSQSPSRLPVNRANKSSSSHNPPFHSLSLVAKLSTRSKPVIKTHEQELSSTPIGYMHFIDSPALGIMKKRISAMNLELRTVGVNPGIMRQVALKRINIVSL